MTYRWEREALAHGWRPPAPEGASLAPALLTAAAFAVGLGGAAWWWLRVGRELVQAEALASLPPAPAASPTRAGGSAGQGPASRRTRPARPAGVKSDAPDPLETLASEVSVAALTDGEAADPVAAPAEAIAEPAPRPRARRKTPAADAADG